MRWRVKSYERETDEEGERRRQTKLETQGEAQRNTDLNTEIEIEIIRSSYSYRQSEVGRDTEKYSQS